MEVLVGVVIAVVLGAVVYLTFFKKKSQKTLTDQGGAGQDYPGNESSKGAKR